MAVDYEAYLRSERWKVKRWGSLLAAGWKCQRCGISAARPEDAPKDWCAPELEVHHKTYERLGNELPDDLEVLCVVCHARHHDAAKHAQVRRHYPGLAKAIERLADEKFVGDDKP